jgi:GNAT superfamily N-acetyltransferase
MTAFRELTAEPADLALLEAFYETLYVSEFPDPDERESLENMIDYLRRKGQGWYGANNYHIVLSIVDGEIMAGAIADYVAEPRAGVLEFLVVSPASRGTGLGKRLLAHVEKLLDADSPGRLRCVVAEVNDPLVSPPEGDNLNPVTRALIWHRWGYRGLDFPYVQPPLSPEHAAVGTLILICKPLREDWTAGVPATVVALIVHEYLRWAMRIERPEGCAEYRAMAEHLAHHEWVGHLALDRYAGTLLDVHTVERPDEPDFEAAMKLYRTAFPPGPLSVPESGFSRALEQPRYHLWTVREAESVTGFASFFTLPSAGFLGYVALTGESGRFRELAARIETQLLTDRPEVRGWYAEVGPETALAPFLHLGFRHLDVDYRQPTTDGETPARLVYKPMGRVYIAPELSPADLLSDVADLLRDVYRVPTPHTHPTYTRLAT